MGEAKRRKKLMGKIMAKNVSKSLGEQMSYLITWIN